MAAGGWLFACFLSGVASSTTEAAPESFLHPVDICAAVALQHAGFPFALSAALVIFEGVRWCGLPRQLLQQRCGECVACFSVSAFWRKGSS